MLFQFHHIALLCKYSGISFIAGSVNHGSFSEQRSYLTAGLGILFYLIGAFLDHKNNPDEIKDWRGIFGLAVIVSIGLGFFTGGLQHFIDSPERSLWVVPAGFITSVFALYCLEGCKKLSKFFCLLCLDRHCSDFRAFFCWMAIFRTFRTRQSPSYSRTCTC